MNDNFRKRNQQTNKHRYLRYDDVYMTEKDTDDKASIDEEWIQDDEAQYEYDDNTRERQCDEYFSGNSNIINEKMIRYQKRRLPPLQRYRPGCYRDDYAEYNRSYLEDEREKGKGNKLLTLKHLWDKFIITFATIISLVCVSWIIYNWNSTNKPQRYDGSGIPVLEPSTSNFKVLPENPGGSEVSYKDKSVYRMIDRNAPKYHSEEKLLPPEDEYQGYPRENTDQSDVEEYSIITERIYFIKLSAGKDKQVLLNETKLLKKKFANLFEGKEIFVKKVSNARGETQRAILVGPYSSQTEALETAHKIGERCSVISVKE